jgi:zinc protease
MNRLLSALLCLPLILSFAPSAQAGVFNAETFTLANGMQVVAVPNHRVPIVSHMVWYKVGNADSPAGKSGIAHFLEHLMFKGTPEVPAGQFSKIVARNGGRDNAFTSHDFTAYFQNVALDRLELVMKMEADRMTNLVLDEKIAATELDVVLEERRSRTDNDPASLLRERMAAVFNLTHPYRNPVIGWQHELSKLTKADAVEFYKRWYAPNNAILIVAGDITAEKLKPLAEKYYGKIPARSVPERVRPQEIEPMANRRVVLRDKAVRQPELSRDYLAPSYRTGEKSRVHALEVLDKLLSGATGRLFKSLSVDQGLASSASASYGGDAWDHDAFVFHVSPRPGVDMAKLEAALDAEIAKLVKDGPTAEEVERAKKQLIAEAAYARDSLHTGAYSLGMALTTGQTVAEVESWPEQIAKVTLADVVLAARETLRDDRAATGLLLPAEGK